jgi:hypothetical protein
MTTELILEFPETNNTKTFRVLDCSAYNPDLDVKCGILEITPPGFNIAAIYDVKSEFDLIINAGNLGLTKRPTANTMPNLPDGVYKIKYSINPNDKIYVEYYYFRNQIQVRRYAGEICNLFQDRCDFSDPEFIERRKQLIWIKELMDAAKYTVEEKNDINAGIKFYNEANKLLKALNGEEC